MSNKHLIQLIIFIFLPNLALYFQTLLCILQITPSRYSVYQLPGKVQSSSFSTQICPKNGFRFGISEKLSQNKNQHPQGLGLKFKKTNIKIRINIFKILCVYVQICQISGKTNNFDFFSPNLPKNRFRVWNSESYCSNKNQHRQDAMHANFQEKRTTLTFLTKICAKMGFGVGISKH